MTDEVFDAVTDGGTEGALGFWRLPGGFEKLLARWSAAGPVAYVEAEYFGGTGEQRAAVSADGELVLGPLGAPTKKWPTAGSVELRARGDGELLCVLVTFSGCGSGGIGPGGLLEVRGRALTDFEATLWRREAEPRLRSPTVAMGVVDRSPGRDRLPPAHHPSAVAISSPCRTGPP
ncbi:hypothetical protein ACOZGD_31515 [Streptomyces murinus]